MALANCLDGSKLRNLLILLTLASNSAFSDQLSTKTYDLCQKISLRSVEPLDFTDLEKKLVCGDPGVEAWRDLPTSQALFFLKTFLQNRGFHHPKIEEKKDHIEVEVGTPTYVTEIVIEGSPENLDVEDYWLHIGRPLTPERLNETETWVNSRLKRRGYPCPKTEMRGNIETGKMTAMVMAGERLRLLSVESEPTPGIVQGILRRYDAFKIGDYYDAMEVELTETRIVNHELVMSTHLNADCIKDGVKLRQTVMPGEPRILAVGFGFDSEQYFLGKFSWRNTRLGDTGSNFEVRSLASFVLQEIALSSDLYYLPVPSRHYVNLFANVRRENERRFDTRIGTVKALPSINRDLGDTFVSVQLGPSYNFIETTRGDAPAISQVTSLDLALQVLSHEYEYYQLSPRSGFKATFNATTTDQSMWSDISAQTYELGVNKLWTLLSYDPPLWVIGFRTSMSTTVVNSDTSIDELPTNYRYFLGGVSDLRGFGRKAIPPDDLGALTKVYMGLEARLMNSLPYRLQPIVFIDMGAIGREQFNLERNRFYSPGTGLRWESPIGGLQGTIAQGMIQGPDAGEMKHLSRWQFYLSFGDVF